MLMLLLALASSREPILTSLYPAGAPRGTTATVRVTGGFDKWPVRAWVEGTGVTMTAAAKSEVFTVVVAADAAPGPRSVRLYDAQGASESRTFVVGTDPEISEAEPNDDYKKPQPVAGDRVVVNGVLQKAGDVDCYGVTLKKGQTLVASMLANRVLGSPMDAVLQVVDSGGFVLAQNDDRHGLDPQITFRAPRDGTFVVRTYAFDETPGATIGFAGGILFVYRLSLTTGAFADRAFPPAVRRGSADAVTLAGVKATRFMEDDEGRFATATADGVMGSARVRLTNEPVVTRKAGKKSQALTLPATVCGTLSAADGVHSYTFAGKAKQVVAVRFDAGVVGSPADGLVRVYDDAGKLVGTVQSREPRKDASGTVTLPRDGTYRVEARDATEATGDEYVYALRLGPPEADVTLTVAAERFALTGGKVDVPVTVTRSGFAGELTVTVEGLPAGVTATVVGKADAAAKVVTLRLSGKGEGAFRIVATAPGVRRVATVKGRGWLWVR